MRKAKRRRETPARKAYPVPRIKGFPVHKQLYSKYSTLEQPQCLPFIPHLVVINSRTQTSEHVTSAPPSLHFVHAACIAMNHILTQISTELLLPVSQRARLKTESARPTCKCAFVGKLKLVPAHPGCFFSLVIDLTHTLAGTHKPAEDSSYHSRHS